MLRSSLTYSSREKFTVLFCFIIVADEKLFAPSFLGEGVSRVSSSSSDCFSSDFFGLATL
jgi:hypothetical protein